ncbi:hypothetical protein [Sphingobacterium sp. BIGb0165]|uniref:hypothetical protein n=1 Tax=Sphingobacterium sp. BIGb0165 TaxID=2940615 RepID=UPI002167F14F|nr:hypothetical protein [Sphingobacterium sp. BIGb0165]MCS4227425.1 hypothetical protein [Sphingobacterium sp. BIGb0165]
MNLLIYIGKKILSELVEAGKAAGITDIDVLEATGHCKTSRGQIVGGATSTVYSGLGIGMGWIPFISPEHC